MHNKYASASIQKYKYPTNILVYQYTVGFLYIEIHTHTLFLLTKWDNIISTNVLSTLFT